jgi:hypothetical protein
MGKGHCEVDVSRAPFRRLMRPRDSMPTLA